DAAEAEDRVDELALRGREGRKREISAIDEPVAVEQHQAFSGHGSSVPARLLAKPPRQPSVSRRAPQRSRKRPSPASRKAVDTISTAPTAVGVSTADTS